MGTRYQNPSGGHSGLSAGIDPDRTCAVVKVTEAVVGIGKGSSKPLELVEIAPGKALIVVGPSKALQKNPGVKLIEIARARYLVTIPPGTPVEEKSVFNYKYPSFLYHSAVFFKPSSIPTFGRYPNSFLALSILKARF